MLMILHCTSPLISLAELNEGLQNALKCVSDWVKNNKLVLNFSKTTCIMVYLVLIMHLGELQLCLTIKGMALEQVYEAKLLGVTLDG